MKSLEEEFDEMYAMVTYGLEGDKEGIRRFRALLRQAFFGGAICAPGARPGLHSGSAGRGAHVQERTGGALMRAEASVLCAVLYLCAGGWMTAAALREAGSHQYYLRMGRLKAVTHLLLCTLLWTLLLLTLLLQWWTGREDWR